MITATLLISLFRLLNILIQLYVAVILISCVFSLLYAFGVLDSRNQIVRRIGDFLYRVTDPVLRPVRRVLPQFGNVDLSPLVVLLVLQYLLVPLLGAVETTILGHLALQSS